MWPGNNIPEFDKKNNNENRLKLKAMIREKGE